MNRPCRIELAGAALALSLMAGIISSSVCIAGTQSRAIPPASSSGRVPADGDSLGSAAHPIPLNATEVSAPRRTPPGSYDRFEVRLGPVWAALYGVPRTVLHAGGVLDANTDAAWDAEANLYSGGGVEVARDRFGGLFLDGGRVLLRDPLDVLGRGGTDGEYWATSAGFEVRF